ncbi:MAG TPA: YlcI/YnfO family protein [Ktedonobacterales bacterium]
MDKKVEQKISIRFPLDVLDAIRQLARAHERSFNGEVVWALREYAKRHPKPEKRDEF